MFKIIGPNVFISSHQIPGQVGHPVHHSVQTADILQVLSFDGALVHKEDNKTGRDKRHGADDEDGNENI